MADIKVVVQAADSITRIGLIGALRIGGKVEVLGPEERDQAQVLVFATDRLHHAATVRLRHETAQSHVPVVLVADEIAEEELYTAVKIGVVAVLIRSAMSIERLTDYVVTAANGGARLSSAMLGDLFRHVHQLQHELKDQLGMSHPGLTRREVDILRLLAEGYSTREIGAKLSYSERTIKNALSTLLSKLGLRNRAHAVAYALRAGAV